MVLQSEILRLLVRATTELVTCRTASKRSQHLEAKVKFLEGLLAPAVFSGDDIFQQRASVRRARAQQPKVLAAGWLAALAKAQIQTAERLLDEDLTKSLSLAISSENQSSSTKRLPLIIVGHIANAVLGLSSTPHDRRQLAARLKAPTMQAQVIECIAGALVT